MTLLVSQWRAAKAFPTRIDFVIPTHLSICKKQTFFYRSSYKPQPEKARQAFNTFSSLSSSSSSVDHVNITCEGVDTSQSPIYEHSPAADATWKSTVHHNITTKEKIILLSSVLAAAFLLASLVIASGPGTWRYYLAGGVCAAVSHSIPVPIDVVKTRKQVDPQFKNLRFIDAFRNIIKKEGFPALLAGLGPTTWGYLLEGALKFGVYEVLKPVVRQRLYTLSQLSTLFVSFNSRIIAFVVAGAISGLAASFVLCPMEGLRIRMVSEPDFAPKGWIQGGYRMWKQEGAVALFKGIFPMFYKQIPYTIVKNVCFDYSARCAYLQLRRFDVGMTTTIKATVPLASAALASVLSCLSSQPGDMLLSLVNAHGGTRKTREIVQDIMQERGISGFFIGVKTRLLHVGLIVTIQLVIYDVVKRMCGIAATGSTW